MVRNRGESTTITYKTDRKYPLCVFSVVLVRWKTVAVQNWSTATVPFRKLYKRASLLNTNRPLSYDKLEQLHDGKSLNNNTSPKRIIRIVIIRFYSKRIRISFKSDEKSVIASKKMFKWKFVRPCKNDKNSRIDRFFEPKFLIFKPLNNSPQCYYNDYLAPSYRFIEIAGSRLIIIHKTRNI